MPGRHGVEGLALDPAWRLALLRDAPAMDFDQLLALLVGGGDVDSESFRVEYDAIIIVGGLQRDIALADVVLHILRRPFERRAKAATAPRAKMKASPVFTLAR